MKIKEVEERTGINANTFVTTKKSLLLFPKEMKTMTTESMIKKTLINS